MRISVGETKSAEDADADIVTLSKPALSSNLGRYRWIISSVVQNPDVSGMHRRLSDQNEYTLQLPMERLPDETPC